MLLERDFQLFALTGMCRLKVNAKSLARKQDIALGTPTAIQVTTTVTCFLLEKPAQFSTSLILSLHLQYKHISLNQELTW